MNKPIPLFFDMDDVQSDTNSFIISELLGHVFPKQFRVVGKKPNLEALHEHLIIHDDIHTLAFQEKLKRHSPGKFDVFNALVKEHILDKGDYMLNVNPIHDVINFIGTNVAQAVKEKRVTLGLITHRGFHAEAEERTMDWLDRQKISYLYEHIHVLDYREHPDKIAFLKKLYGEDFYLVDDNPIVSDSIIPHHKQLIIYTNGRKHLPRYSNQVRVGTAGELNAHLTELGVIGYY